MRLRRRQKPDQRDAWIAQLEALVRASLLHRAGRRDLLFFSMRERYDTVALRALGYDSLDELVEEADRLRNGRTR